MKERTMRQIVEDAELDYAIRDRFKMERHPEASVDGDDRWARDVTCTTKKSYPSKSQVKKKVKELRRGGDRHITWYPCRYCPLFHVGHIPGFQTYRRPGRPFG